ncbi:VOC family protein [Saccharomonospora azurea]|uniref:VOC family protein n=1 Tax=Saccharomonospora azurea TaxID=40988 RepID=UPI003D8A63FE
MGTALSTLKVVQVAYATTDVRASALRWHRLYGAGPFFVREHVPTASVTVDDGDGVFDHTCALGQWGDVMVEFVHHHELAPASLDRDMRRGDTGLHHVACFVDDLEQARDRLVAEGARVVMDAATPEVRFVFLDVGPEVGHLVEIYERTPYLAGLYDRVRQASVGWDGTDPLRERR